METVRKILLALSKTTLVISILWFVVGFIFMQTLGKPDQTKQIISESGLYSVIGNDIREQFIKDEAQLSGAPNALIQDSINKTIDDERIKGYAESGIDNVYGWLEGEDANPEITVDINSIKSDFANTMAANIQTRVATLPACSRGVTPTTNDITAIECIPRGYNTAVEIEKIRQQILTSETAIDGTNPNGMMTFSLNGDQAQQNQPPTAQSITSIKTAYTWAKRIPVMSAILFTLSAAAIFILSKPRYRALKTVGLATIPYGILYVVGGLFVPGVISRLFTSATQESQTDRIAQPLQYIGQSIADSVSNYLIWLGIALTAAGIVCFALYKYLHKKDTFSTTATSTSRLQPRR